MVIAAAKPKHAHKFEIESLGKGITRGTCACGEIREYSGWGKEATFKIIQWGDQNYQDMVSPLKPPKPAENIPNNIPEKLQSEAGKTEVPAENTEMLAEKEGPVPPKPKGRGYIITRYYDANKDRILADLKRLGEPEMLKRWNITKAIWEGTVKRWTKAKDSPSVSQVPAAVPVKQESTIADLGKDLAKYGLRVVFNTEPQNAAFPAFPAFESSWPETVQLRWIDGYVELKKMEACK